MSGRREATGAPTTAFVCRKCKGHRALAADLARCPGTTVREVGCQKVCSKAVVGVRTNGRLVWFERVSTAKRRRALCRFVLSGGALPRLRKLIVSARKGRRRGRP